jgi:hypothetical protein
MRIASPRFVAVAGLGCRIGSAALMANKKIVAPNKHRSIDIRHSFSGPDLVSLSELNAGLKKDQATSIGAEVERWHESQVH